MRLQGKNAIVTGARTGIGRAIVETFAREGANVWAIVHREDQEWLSAMDRLSTEWNVWIKPVYIDLSDEEQVKQGMQTIIKEKLQINILVNAAGVLSPKRLFTMTNMADMRQLMDVNFYAVILLSQLVARVMMRQKSGSIINISSISKMLMDEDAEAVELLRNNTYLKRIGQPEDVAMMAAYLASEEAAYVTGQVICVDGGM